MLAHTGSSSLEFSSTENSLPLLVELLEDSLKGGFAVRVRIESEDAEEGTEVHVSTVAGVVDDGQNLLCLVLDAQCTDGVHEFINGDVPTTIIVENIENFLQFMHGLNGKLGSGVFLRIKAFLNEMKVTAGAFWTLDINLMLINKQHNCRD